MISKELAVVSSPVIVFVDERNTLLIENVGRTFQHLYLSGTLKPKHFEYKTESKFSKGQ